ncbi:uncharacterized protein LY79DRAFT_544701 [Colletotrichum navitas]|uniref:Uncharacterized protein n=1 Tax=Colletotrichum navitas TaxID=681940 RepID=A0AAD8V6T8_9PEZI|nr:uncharacterized protein LY79DRAFT_544701 [Colletotrichum navitas]KAK1596402.1 hypothetical protein LY79DRAFT_544701 [Colletotrichum navitas]
MLLPFLSALGRESLSDLDLTPSLFAHHLSVFLALAGFRLPTLHPPSLWTLPSVTASVPPLVRPGHPLLHQAPTERHAPRGRPVLRPFTERHCRLT